MCNKGKLAQQNSLNNFIVIPISLEAIHAINKMHFLVITIKSKMDYRMHRTWANDSSPLRGMLLAVGDHYDNFSSEGGARRFRSKKGESQNEDYQVSLNLKFFYALLTFLAHQSFERCDVSEQICR